MCLTHSGLVESSGESQWKLPSVVDNTQLGSQQRMVEKVKLFAQLSTGEREMTGMERRQLEGERDRAREEKRELEGERDRGREEKREERDRVREEKRELDVRAREAELRVREGELRVREAELRRRGSWRKRGRGRGWNCRKLEREPMCCSGGWRRLRGGNMRSR